MIRVAIVEDDRLYQRQLSDYVHQYEAESGDKYAITIYQDGYDIIEKYKANYDIIFMDIQMKGMDGMEAARKIRHLDENVILIFITNMAQFAIQGYQVKALDYVLKPVTYFAFSKELEKAVKQLKNRRDSYLMFMQEKGMVRLETATIRYLESHGHNLTVHGESGVYTFRSTMKEMEQKLGDKGFVRCNSGYLVNLRYVEEVNGNIVRVAGDDLQISRPRRKTFMEALTDYLGGK